MAADHGGVRNPAFGGSGPLAACLYGVTDVILNDNCNIGVSNDND